MKRVRIRNLAYPGDGLYYLKDKSFTGVAIYKRGRWVEAEEEFRDGLHWGRKREWYRPGALRLEAQLAWGVYHGLVREWHENGRLATDAVYEHGFRLQEKRWDEEGNLVEDFHLRKKDPAYRALLRRRSVFGEVDQSGSSAELTGPLRRTKSRRSLRRNRGRD